MRTTRLALAALTSAALAAPLLAGDEAATLKKEKEIALEGDAFYDYVTADAAGKRLYVAHSPNIDVVDLEKGARVGTVEGVNKAHGVALSPENKRGFATAGGKDKVIVFDLETLKPAGEVKTGGKPDAILAVTTVGEIWSMNGNGKDATCIDPKTLEVKATIKLGEKPEFAVEYPEKGLVFVNFEEKDSICAIDAKKHAVVGTYPLAPGKGPTGLAIDVKTGILFAGCDEKLVAFDAASNKVTGSFDIGKGCDGVAFDPGTKTAFASCGDGKVYVLHEKDAKTFELLPPIETVKGARTCTVDPGSHRLFVCSKGDKGISVLVFSPGK